MTLLLIPALLAGLSLPVLLGILFIRLIQNSRSLREEQHETSGNDNG